MTDKDEGKDEMADNDLGQALDFDGTVTDFDESEFQPVAPGTYRFEVESVERGQFNGSDRMAPCPVAKVRVRLLDEPRRAVVFSNLFCSSKVAWRLSAFFKSVGLRDPDADSHVPLRLDWKGAIGRQGACKVGAREYKGKTYNDVTEWLKPEKAPETPKTPETPGSYDLKVAKAKVETAFPGTKTAVVPATDPAPWER